MNKEKRRVPKLRFPGFTEDWEQRKLGEFVKIVSGDAPSTFISGNCIYVKVDDLNYSDRIQLSSSNLVNANSKAHLVNQGATIFPKRGAAIMTNKVRIMGKDGYLDTNMMASIPEEIDKDFLFTFIQKTGLYKIADTSTIPQINNKHIEPYIIQVPSEKEQAYIGVVFEKIDKIITLHQRKLEHLNLKKKALLQKLFPKNGERHPELRFPGFTDAWEQRKLGDFYTFKNGLNKEKVYFGYGDSIVNFTDVFHNRQIYSSTLKGKVCVNKKELENYKVKEGDLFFTRTSETIDEIGFPAVVMEPMERVVFSGFVLRGRAEKNDPLVNIFKSYIFFTDNFRSEMKKKSSMTTRALTSGTALKEMYFSYPKDLEEQTKIGEILLRLDNIITLHQRKLEHLQLQKKALLQQMFV